MTVLDVPVLVIPTAAEESLITCIPNRARDPSTSLRFAQDDTKESGKMMGVDFNKDKTWVGSSIALHER